MRRHGLFLLAAFLVAVLSGLGGCDKNAPAANLGLAGALAQEIFLLAVNRNSMGGSATLSTSRWTVRN